MASRGGIYYNKKTKEVKPQYFVKEARHHPNGFTVYKVICRVPNPNSFDCFKESFVWKRYSDFRDLYKYLATLHRKLYLNGKIPEFAKPKLFGRFEDNVVAERRESAEKVLNFATEHPPLLKSAVFKEFFQFFDSKNSLNNEGALAAHFTLENNNSNHQLRAGLKPIDATSEIRYLQQSPLKPNVKKERKSIDGEEGNEPESQLTGEDLQLFDPFLSTKEFIESTSTRQDETWIEQIKKAFPPATGPEPSADSYQPREVDAEDEAELLEALKFTVTQSDLENYHQQQKLPSGDHNEQSSSGKEVTQGNEETSQSQMRPNIDLEGLTMDDSAREQHRKSSKASAYLESVIRQNKLDAERPALLDSYAQNKNQVEPKPSVKNGGHVLLEKPAFIGMTTRSSLLDLPKMFRDESSDDESRGAYLTQAAQQISFARVAEIKLSYEEAFGHYKAAINTLLQGVQGDTNEARIQAVRRKTANYLKRAEDIHSEHLKATIDTNDLWKPDSKSSSPRPTMLYPSDVQRTRRDTSSPVPNIPSPRHNSKDLSCYKVLGTIGKVLLVLDTRNNETYAMKVLVKSCLNRLRKGVIPTNVPYMVRLHRYHSTEHAVCLVIEHASGGRLWDQLQPYFDLAKAKNSLPDSKKILKVPFKLTGGRCSTPKELHHRNQDSDKEDDAENDGEEACSHSFLDVCMEYQTEDPKNVRMSGNEEESRSLEVQVPQPESITDAIETPTEEDKQLPSVQSTSSSDHLPVQRSWSYLSWDDISVTLPTEDENVLKVNQNAEAEDLKPDANWRMKFQKISSKGDLNLFTIDPDEDTPSLRDDAQEDSIYDSRSNDGSEDDNEELERKSGYKRELLSEQDMSAFSLLGDNTEKTLTHGVASPEPALQSASPSLSRILDESKSSPCLSLNSSFEEDRRRSEEQKDSQIQAPTITRVVDENGVSSIDAKKLFRTRSRTRSTASISDDKTMEKPDLVKDVVLKDLEEDAVKGEDNGTKIHSIFSDMDKAKKRSMSYRIPEYTIQQWAAQIVVAVGTLHSIGILCRDLNPNNILLSANGHIRLSYFGKWRQVERKPCDKWAAKHLYVAPEMSKVNEKKTEACDWWSVGAIIYELLTGTPLHVAHSTGINSHTMLSIPDYLSSEAKSLLTGLLQYYPTQRFGYGIMGLDDLMEHPFFNDIEWDFLIEKSNSS